ncbi:hypothetical protein KIN20_026744 [Parelaphostrongylus tenuis]|uniref:Uncharacterized protein n=1 Tax=Parelaphostrongylus tenuis TaxID=148309 RepID=A0AAD5QYE0_PARTN|nr:hypothetical protein KIN20_026744 [Parelaphostrongylus tenuis]
MTNLPTNPLIIPLLNIPIVLGCGVMPLGQAGTRSFTVTGFTLPTSLVYSGNPTVRAKASGIQPSSGAVQAFVSRIVTQTISDVLRQQGRNVLLSDAIISAILNQLDVRINYVPLECTEVEKDPMNNFASDMTKKPHCIIVRSTVSALCTATGAGGNDMCNLGMSTNIGAISANHTSMTGSLTV